jgi:hypothetical protein
MYRWIDTIKVLADLPAKHVVIVNGTRYLVYDEDNGRIVSNTVDQKNIVERRTVDSLGRVSWNTRDGKRAVDSVDKRCPCGKLFVPFKDDQKYHNQRCYRDFNRERERIRAQNRRSKIKKDALL